MVRGDTRICFFFFFSLFLPLVFSASTSENYSISNIAIEPSTSGSSENYLIYDVGEEAIGSDRGTSTNYTLWIGFPATVGVLRVPGPFNVTVDSNTQLTISWDSNGNPPSTTFQLQETSPVSQSLYSGTDTQFVHSNLTASQEYCYKIRAYAGVYTVFSAQKCVSTLPSDPIVDCNTHVAGEWSNDGNVTFTAVSDANHFYYAWDQFADTTVYNTDTWWDGNTITLEAVSDGNWYLHVVSANADNNLNAGGTVHYGPYSLDINAPYTYDDANSEWQTTDVHVTLIPTDETSAITATYYCIDLNNSCSPSTSGTSFDVTCSTTCQQYIRYYSNDSAGNTESIKSKLIRIDKEAPQTPDLEDEGSVSYDFVLTFTYNVDDNSGSGVNDFFLELRRDSNDGVIVYEGWTGDSDGSYDYLGAENTYRYYARGKVRDAVGHESAFSSFTDGVYVNATAHPASDNYSVDIYTIVPSGQVDSNNYSIYDLVVGQPAVSMSSDNYSAETGFAGGFIENSAPTLVLNSPNQGYYGPGTISIDFNLIDAEDDRVYLTLAYSLTQGGFQHKLLEDVNLDDYQSISGLDCDNNNWATSTNCTYSWNIDSVQDNNYYIDLNAWDSAGASHRTSSSASIKIDKTAPTTTSDANTQWQGTDQNITLSCNDGSGSGCVLTQYRLDTNPSKTVSFGAWQTYSEPFTVSSDGNWAIDFNSKDLVGNIETTNRQYVLINYAFSTMSLVIPAGIQIEITEDGNRQLQYKCVDIAGNIEEAKFIYVCLDKNAPITLDDINSEWRSADANITLSPSDTASGVLATYYCVDDTNSCSPVDGNTGTSFRIQCAEGSTCQKYVRFYSVDLAGNTETVHGKLARIDNQLPATTSAGFMDGWQGDLNVVVSCTDYNGSGCNKLMYRIDSGEWQETPFIGSDANISITTDGNHLVEYYPLDGVGNAGTTNSAWQAVDKAPPGITITDPSTDYMEKGTPVISFNLERGQGSAIVLSSVVVDFNGVVSDDFNALAHCTASGGDYNCSYTEYGLSEDDYNLSVTATDVAGNTLKVSRVFTLKAVIGVRNAMPSGTLVNGMQQIQFEVKNTMLNDVYAVLYYSDWFGEFDNNITGTLHLDDHSGIEGLWCEDTEWWNWTLCTYDWNSLEAADGNYFIDVNFWNASGGMATGHSAQPFLLDNTPPKASISGVSITPVFSDRIYLGCRDAGSGCKALKWYYFNPTPECSALKADYNYSTTHDYVDIATDHNDYICLWVEDRVDLNDTVLSAQLHVDTGVYVVSSIPSDTQSIVTQDLNNECTMYLDQNLTIACEFKSTIKISQWAKDLNRVWPQKPELVTSPAKTIRVLLQSEIEAFYHKDYFIKFESKQRTITSQGSEKNYPITVVRRRIVPLLTTDGQLELGMLIIKVRQR